MVAIINVASQLRDRLMLNVDHIALSTTNLENTIAWYQSFLGCALNWEQRGGFSPVTLHRLPDITRLVELQTHELKIHIIEHGPEAASTALRTVNHIAVRVPELQYLRTLRERWIDLYTSGHYRFERSDMPTDIITDTRGASSFYAYDVNGVEFEFICLS